MWPEQQVYILPMPNMTSTTQTFISLGIKLPHFPVADSSNWINLQSCYVSVELYKLIIPLKLLPIFPLSITEELVLDVLLKPHYVFSTSPEIQLLVQINTRCTSIVKAKLHCTVCRL